MTSTTWHHQPNHRPITTSKAGICFLWALALGMVTVDWTTESDALRAPAVLCGIAALMVVIYRRDKAVDAALQHTQRELSQRR